MILGYLSLRFCLYLPSVALNDHLGPGAAWAAGWGAVLKLALGYFLLFTAMAIAHIAVIFGVSLIFETIDLLAALFINVSALWTADGAPSGPLAEAFYWGGVALNIILLTFYLFFWSAALSAYPAIAYRQLSVDAS